MANKYRLFSNVGNFCTLEDYENNNPVGVASVLLTNAPKKEKKKMKRFLFEVISAETADKPARR